MIEPLNTPIIEILPEGPIKEWYLKHIGANNFEQLSDIAKQKGYSFNPHNGLFFRQILSEEINKGIGRTITDILFPRPVDFHYHTDVSEYLIILNGLGLAHISGKDDIHLKQGTTIEIPRGVHHTFRPNKYFHLEMRLACTGILNTKKEFTITQFDKYQPWVDYFGNQQV